MSSWNEWDPLREVIVGSVLGAADMGYEPALAPYFNENDPARSFPGGAVLRELAADAERQMDGLAELLVRQGVVVRRPDPFDQAVSVKTPDWQAATGRAIACPRDVLLVIGDEIIEAPMAQRGRYFEFRAYRSLIKQYFREGARWTAAPKPLMTDALYHPADVLFDHEQGPLLTEFEPAFDAASFARFGRDIFWQPDMVSNDFGAAWLARHLGPGFRVHRMPFREPTPVHIDATFVPLRPGLALTNPERPCLNDMLDLFRRNDWRLVDAPSSVRTGNKQAARDVSNWISMNILMLDERTAIVEQAEKPMIELLRSLGVESIPCAFDRVYPFGGGLHCCTMDIHREGTLRSYFPSLD
ncbi:MAG TPA: serine/threonine protein kinase [Rhizomicrobium sp.]